MKSASLLLRLAIGFLVLINLSCRKDVIDKVHPAPNEVWLQNVAFNPVTIAVKAGTTVTWINKDGMDHTVTSTESKFDSGNLVDGQSFSFTFTTAGSYPYICAYHPDMSGTVVVQ